MGDARDLALALFVDVTLLVVPEGAFEADVVAALVVATAYVLGRRVLADITQTVFGRVPERLDGYVPERYRRGRGHPGSSSRRSPGRRSYEIRAGGPVLCHRSV